MGYLGKAMGRSNDRICKNCNCTYHSHCGAAYYSELYSKRIPLDYCPGNEGMADWDKSKGTLFEESGKYRERKKVKTMKIGNTKIIKEHIGTKVTYIPPHAKGNAGHKDCQGGTIGSWNSSFIFVNYGTGTNAATKPENLVWG